MTLVDTNVLLDLVTNDPVWFAWSVHELDRATSRGPVLINDIIFAEMSVRMASIESVEAALREADIALVTMPRASLFLAGKIYQRYRTIGGPRPNLLPDFFIGVHAAVGGLALLTRDARRYRHYFPTIDLITP